MARTPEPADKSATTSWTAELLTTKMHIPRLPACLVPRQRLVDRLDDGLSRPLTLVCAPAGFGKTALLAEWIQRRQLPVGWLSLDAGDKDPVRFWRHVAAVLDQIRPGMAETLGPLLDGSGTTSFEQLATAAINGLAADPGEVVLVLDDYHLIDAEPVHASLRFFVEHQPPTFHVTLSSRADPPWPLARLRARDQVTEIRAADLRFAPDEAAELLSATVGSPLRDDAAGALAARTEGWAAGLQLAGLSLQNQPDVAAFVESFSGSNRYVLDYLTEEVLEQQPPPVSDFLLATSMLERLSGSLCDAVTGRTDSQQMLETIERANLFLVPLDEVRGWWRYHHLFGDALHSRLRQQQPDRLLDLHLSAAAWFEAHGCPYDAVPHALAARDADLAARLVERYFDELVLVNGESATVRRWIDALPRAHADARPRLLVGRALLAIYAGQLDEAEALLNDTRAADAEPAGEERYEPSVGRSASLLANVPAAIASTRAFVTQLRGDPDATIANASQALDRLAGGEWRLAATVHGHLATAKWLCGRLDEAERAFASSIAQLRGTGAVDATAGGRSATPRAAASSYYRGRIQCAQGRLDAALETHRQALAVDAPPGPPANPAAGVAYVGMTEVAYQWDDLDTALRHVTDGIALCRRFIDTQFLAAGLAALASIRQATGHESAALDAMLEAEQMAKPAVTDLLNPIPAQRARLQLARGDVDTAAKWIAERGLTADDEPSYPQEPAYLVLACVLLAREQHAAALRLLRRLHADATAQGRVGSVLEIQALRAVALADTGDGDGAVAVLTETLTLGRPQGYVRVFADAGPPMRALVGRLIEAQRDQQAAAKGVPVDYLGRLLRAFDRDAPANDGGQAPATGSGLPTALTERELEVLRLLAAGKQNQQIAAELFLALDTVKKHVTHIFSKIGASNRTEATARARSLGLLP